MKVKCHKCWYKNEKDVYKCEKCWDIFRESKEKYNKYTKEVKKNNTEKTTIRDQEIIIEEKQSKEIKTKRNNYVLIIFLSAIFIALLVQSTQLKWLGLIAGTLGFWLWILIIPIIIFYLFFLISRNKKNGLKTWLIISLIIMIIQTVFALIGTYYTN